MRTCTHAPHLSGARGTIEEPVSCAASTLHTHPPAQHSIQQQGVLCCVVLCCAVLCCDVLCRVLLGSDVCFLSVTLLVAHCLFVVRDLTKAYAKIPGKKTGPDRTDTSVIWETFRGEVEVRKAARCRTELCLGPCVCVESTPFPPPIPFLQLPLAHIFMALLEAPSFFVLAAMDTTLIFCRQVTTETLGKPSADRDDQVESVETSRVPFQYVPTMHWQRDAFPRC